jgi:hypothetical protein
MAFFQQKISQIQPHPKILRDLASGAIIPPATDARAITTQTVEIGEKVTKDYYGDGRSKPGVTVPNLHDVYARGSVIDRAAVANAQNFFGNSSKQGGNVNSGGLLNNYHRPNATTTAFSAGAGEKPKEPVTPVAPMSETVIGGYTTGQILLAGLIGIVVYSMFK